jgi:hypothetical protein
MPPLVLSKVMTLVRNDKMELAEALNKVTEDALKEEQAKQTTPPDQMTPDMAMAGQTVEAMAGPQAAIQGPNPSQANLSDLLSTLRRPQGATGGI